MCVPTQAVELVKAHLVEEVKRGLRLAERGARDAGAVQRLLLRAVRAATAPHGGHCIGECPDRGASCEQAMRDVGPRPLNEVVPAEHDQAQRLVDGGAPDNTREAVDFQSCIFRPGLESGFKQPALSRWLTHVEKKASPEKSARDKVAVCRVF